MNNNNVELVKKMNVQFQEFDVDENIINETNKEIKEIEQDLLDIYESMRILNELTNWDTEKIETVELKVNDADLHIKNALDQLNDAIDEYNKANEKWTVIKTVGGATVGAVIGGVGFVFGAIPGSIIFTLATATGATTGYISKFF